MAEAAAPAPAAEPMEVSEVPSTEEGDSSSPSDAAGSSSMEEEDDEEVSILWCSGDAPGSPQQHNFEGDWHLLKEHLGAPLGGPRPCFEHAAPDGTPVFLFFVESTPAGPAPRWVIGPTPGNGVNGWAYADSTAAKPEDIFEPWHSWVKETSEWTEARLAFTPKRSGMGREDADEIDDEEGTEDAGGEAGGEGASGNTAPKKKGTKKKGTKGGASKGATKGGAKANAKKPAAAKPKAK